MTKEKLDLLVNTNEFVVIDLETTGLSYRKGARITDICAYKIKDYQYTSKFITLVNPGVSISKEIEELTGINDTMVKWAPNIYDVLPKLEEFIGNNVVVGHNIKFDWNRFILPIFKDKRFKDLTNETLCTLQLSKELVQCENNKLAYVYKYLTGKDPKVQHRAEPDVIMTCEILCIIKRFCENNYEKLCEYCK